MRGFHSLRVRLQNPKIIEIGPNQKGNGQIVGRGRGSVAAVAREEGGVQTVDEGRRAPALLRNHQEVLRGAGHDSAKGATRGGRIYTCSQARIVMMMQTFPAFQEPHHKKQKNGREKESSNASEEDGQVSYNYKARRASDFNGDGTVGKMCLVHLRPHATPSTRITTIISALCPIVRVHVGNTAVGL